MQALSLVSHLEIAHFMNFVFYFSVSLWSKEGRVHELDLKGQIVERSEAWALGSTVEPLETQVLSGSPCDRCV